jgi:hypothetical protein
MIIRILFFAVVLSSFSSFALANPLKKAPIGKRIAETYRVHETIKVDGVLDEESWGKAIPANDFFQYEPFNGSFPSERTEVKVLYDNNAIYIGATLYDDDPNKIYKELGKRDNSDNLRSDAFSILISPYNDGINYLEFIISSSGVQTDIRRTGNSSDRSWDAVWQSSVSFNEKGWVVEIKIPFSALRFSSKTNGNWGLNFRRLIKRYNEWSSWNPIDNSISGIVNQSGELSGIKDIRTPIRLSFSPYISTYVEKHPDNQKPSYRFNGGMDLQFGISESFTLDMTLIPDFGQVKSDDKVLNISPFEVMYGEQRPFFKEGMDMFQKGGIFNSRRIGQSPKGFSEPYRNLTINEIVTNNPQETSLINASKITGRTSKGLGVGFLNAITSSTWANILDTVTLAQRKFLTQGFTNYNMTVLDQTLRNNSYVSLANTNLFIPEQDYVANVSATDFVLRNKGNRYALYGKGVLSQISKQDYNLGYKYSVGFDKTSGNFLYSLWTNTESKTYNPNDMGYLQKANEFSNGAAISYKIYKPFWIFLNWTGIVGGSYYMLQEPMAYTSSNLYFNIRTVYAKTYHAFGVEFWMDPKEIRDYNEPRVEGRMVVRSPRKSASFWTSSDYRKPLAIDTRAGYWKAEKMGQENWYASFSPRVRVSDNIFLVYQIRQDYDKNNIGYVSRSNDSQTIYMGLRDVSTLTNTIDGLYSFSANSFLNLRIRHYWRWLDYSTYHTLNTDGSLSVPIVNSGFNKNTNYNTFNIDLTFQWSYAPGSLLSIVWKNDISLYDNKVRSNYFDNLGGLLDQSQTNSISLRMLYFLDYNTVRSMRKG